MWKITPRNFYNKSLLCSGQKIVEDGYENEVAVMLGVMVRA
jgi:hypothetical protein